MKTYDVRMYVVENDLTGDFAAYCDICKQPLYISTGRWDKSMQTPRGKLIGTLAFEHKCFLRDQPRKKPDEEEAR
jgi:hypothetical protein